VDKRLRDSFGIVSGEGQFNVVIRFSQQVADYVREKRWHPSQQLRELRGGGVELRLKLSSLVEIQRWIMSWGGEAAVLQPPELAAQVRKAARRILHPPAGLSPTPRPSANQNHTRSRRSGD
jgi:proteasome accessory factor B